MVPTRGRIRDVGGIDGIGLERRADGRVGAGHRPPATWRPRGRCRRARGRPSTSRARSGRVGSRARRCRAARTPAPGRSPPDRLGFRTSPEAFGLAVPVGVPEPEVEHRRGRARRGSGLLPVVGDLDAGGARGHVELEIPVGPGVGGRDRAAEGDRRAARGAAGGRRPAGEARGRNGDRRNATTETTARRRMDDASTSRPHRGRWGRGAPRP